MVKREMCSPIYKKNNSQEDFTCYTPTHLVTLKNKFNQKNKNTRKKIKGQTVKQIWKELDKNIKTCKTESCWGKELNVPVKDVFAPKSPESWKKNKNEWLSSTDITSVLKQYEQAYPDFKYIGPSPSDYDFKENGKCVWQELCDFNVNTTKYKYIGVVFNLDEHNGGGTHWVSIFVHMPRKKVYYFDSTGDEILENISHFVDQIKSQNPSFQLETNIDVEHQFGNTECGMYTLFFIITMLQTGNFSLFNGKKTHFPDKKMEKLRKKYFNS